MSIPAWHMVWSLVGVVETLVEAYVDAYDASELVSGSLSVFSVWKFGYFFSQLFFVLFSVFISVMNVVVFVPFR